MSNSPLGRPAHEMKAAQDAVRDAQAAVARCLHCPDWVHEGTAAECRTASATHRARYHSDTRVAKRRRHVSRWNPGLESDRAAGEARAAETARMLARRQVA